MLKTSIAPWLPVADGREAVKFYGSAFGAKVVYQLEDPEGGLIARLSVDGAEFWVATDPEASINSPKTVPIRMILTVSDPDNMYDAAIRAGARSIYPVSEDHGWRIGRIEDPFGYHWEIARPLAEPLPGEN